MIRYSALGLLLAALILSIGCSSSPGEAGIPEEHGELDASADTLLDAPPDEDSTLPEARPDVENPDVDPPVPDDADAADVADSESLAPWPAPREGCNGHPQLCDRPLPEVVFAATHNSMSNRQDGWAAPNQNLNMRHQLIDGVRAFLIDVYDRNGRILLCHGFCNLGSRPLLEAMEEIADFLHDQPGEVIALLIEDYVTSEVIAEVLTEAGLAPFAHTQDPDEAWPTLGEMVASNQRLLVLAQDSGPPPAWVHNLWRHGWDTPFTFDRPEAFSCRANRGSSTNALFLINHWILDPAARPANAEIVNTYDALMARVEACSDQWDRLPTFLAVDFHDVGDLLEVVDVLNGVRPAREADE